MDLGTLWSSKSQTVQRKMEDKITPEEKLLKIIENPQTSKEMASRPASKGAGVSVKPPAGFLKRLNIEADISKYLTLRTANRGMVVLCVIATVIFITSYVTLGSSLNKRYDKVAEEATMSDISAKKIFIPEERFSEIVQAAKARNMFTALPISAAAQAAAPVEVVQTITNLKLVGILWSDSPQAMIEDSQEKKTYLVGGGEQIGQFKVDSIARNKVVLSREGQTWELR